MLTLEKPNAVLPLLPIPIVPEHVWKNVTEKAVKTYRPSRPTASPSSAPARSGWSRARPAARRTASSATPTTGRATPHVDEVVFRVYKAEDPMVQALIKGEVDFAEGITPLQVRALEGEEGITAQNGDSPGFDEIAFNTGAIDTETERADR